MNQNIRVKICGLSDPGDVEFAVDAGADYVGFVLFPKSPRHVAAAQLRELASAADGAITVAVLVNPDDQEIGSILKETRLGMLQLHGGETPERVAEVRERFGAPIMKAIGIRDEADINSIDIYAEVADQLLLDAKSPPGMQRPGGSGTSFDWQLIADRSWQTPWMLAGGLDARNVQVALQESGAAQVDVSSGVESAPGRKNRSKISSFINTVRGC